MKKCIICEKPFVAKTITNAIYENFIRHDGYFESENYIITFAFGHLFEPWEIEDYLKKEKGYWTLDDLPFIPKEFKFKLKNDDGIKKQFSIIKKLVNRDDVEAVVNCGDSDREGELLCSIIISNALEKTKPILRLWLPEQTEDTIRKSLKNMPPNSEYENLYNEGLLRTIMDYLLGIEYTRYLSILSKHKLPVGRVLIPIVKAIYDRDSEIKNFISEDFYTIKGINEDKKISFLVMKTDKNIPLDIQKKEGNSIINSLYKQAEVIDIEEKEIIKRPKKLFSLDTLQNKMSKDYKLSASKTLDILQGLYLKGFVTYPRTNTEYLSENEKGKVSEIIDILLKDGFNLAMNENSSIFDSSKVESHSAVIITKKVPDMTALSNDEKLIYETIKNRFICNFLIDKAVVMETRFLLKIGSDLEAELKGKVIKEEGYLKYENDLKEALIPNLILNEKVDIDYKLELSKTKPKPHMNTEELNKFLKNPFKKESDSEDDEYKNILEGLEIGTVATRGQIIDNAIHYGYIESKKNYYYITDLGVNLINLLNKLEINLYKEKTVELSKILKKVYKGEETVESGKEYVKCILEASIRSDVEVEKIDSPKEIIGKCPRCGRNVYEGSKSFYCEGYKENPKCSFTIWKENKFFLDKGKKITKSMASKLLKNKTIDVKGFKTKDGKGEYSAKVEMFDKEFNNNIYVNFKIVEFIN